MEKMYFLLLTTGISNLYLNPFFFMVEVIN